MPKRHPFDRAIAFLSMLVLLTLGSSFLTAQARAQEVPAGEFLRETHGDWNIRCASDAPEECFMVLVGTNAEGTPMIEVSLVKLRAAGPATAGTTVIVPLGTALPEGVVLQVDDGDRFRFSYEFCAPAGCVANLAMTPELVTAMKVGYEAIVTFAAASDPQTPISIPISLSGFTAAYNALN